MEKNKVINPCRWIRPSFAPSDSLYVETLPPYPSPVQALQEYAKEYENSDLRFCDEKFFYTCNKRETADDASYYVTLIVVRNPAQVRGVLAKGELMQDETPLEAAQRTGARILVNGSFYEHDFSRCGADLWIKDEKILSGDHSNGREICLKKDGSFFSPGYNTAESVIKEGVVFSWGTFNDTLIEHGKCCTLADKAWASEIYSRTGVGMVRPLEYYLITAGEGIKDHGLSLFREQEIFASLGCWYARDLDGGASTALIIDGVCIRDNVDPKIKEKHVSRRIPDFLAFF